MSTTAPDGRRPVLEHLGSVLDSAGYTVVAVAERLRIDSELRIREADVPVHVHRLTAGDALDGLIRLFLFQLPMQPEHAQQLLSPMSLPDLQGVGLLQQEQGIVQATVKITPHSRRWFAHDSNDPNALQPESVLGWTGSGRTLANLTVRRPVRTALDLGTGSGGQAILIAEHAERVVAVDINPRALWLTELNCGLNKVTNVECRQGDLFEPVHGETFDLIVSNPPFVISPDTEYIFRDAGRGADSMSSEVVAGAAAALREGGFATVLCNWILAGDEPWWSRPASWVEGSGCDALLLYYETLDPLKYASMWLHRGTGPREEYERALDRWLEYYRTAGVNGVGIGALVLRRRSSGPNWLRKGQIVNGPIGSCSDQLLRIFAAQDALRGMTGDEALLGMAFELVDPHRLKQVLRHESGGYIAEDAELVLDEGIGLQNRVPPDGLHVLLRMDGTRPLRDLLEETADETDLEYGNLTKTVVPCVRELFELGFLTAAPTGPAAS